MFEQYAARYSSDSDGLFESIEFTSVSPGAVHYVFTRFRNVVTLYSSYGALVLSFIPAQPFAEVARNELDYNLRKCKASPVGAAWSEWCFSAAFQRVTYELRARGIPFGEFEARGGMSALETPETWAFWLRDNDFLGVTCQMDRLVGWANIGRQTSHKARELYEAFRAAVDKAGL